MDITQILVLGALYVVLILASTIIVYVADSLGRYKVYQKAGLPNAWGAWIPFYKDWIFLKMGNFPGLIAFLPLIPMAIMFIVLGIGSGIPKEIAPTIFSAAQLTYYLLAGLSFVISIFSSVLVGTWLQKPKYWAILYLFFPYVWFLINGFDQSQWVSPRPKIEKFSLEDYNNYNKQAPEENVKPGELPVVDMTPGPALASGLAAFLPVEEPPTPPTSGKRKR